VDNVDADTWIVNNRRDAHVLTTCYDIDDVLVEDAFVDEMIKPLLIDERVVHRRTKPAAVGLRRLARVEIHGDISFLVDINTIGDSACVVRLFAPRAWFLANVQHHAAILDSFRFIGTAAAALEPTQAGLVVGRDASYTYRAPAGFKLLPRDQWPATNNTMDRWLTDPVLDEHLITRCERASADHVFDARAFFDLSVADHADEGDTVERTVIPDDTTGRGRATLTSAAFITIIDTAVVDDVGCSTVVVVSRRHAATVPTVIEALDTFKLTASTP